jgi:hypothetical protein
MTSKPDKSVQRGEAGIGRPGGLLVMAVMAALTFFVGRAIIGSRAPQAPQPAPVAVVDAGRPATVDATAADAAALDALAADATSTADAAAATTVADASTGTKGAELGPASPAAPNHKLAPADTKDKEDKDTAHEAWRANAPSIAASGGKSVMIIPLKGSIDGATFKMVRKSKAVIVTLPKAAAMITMRLYNLKRDGFKQLWVYQEEVNAKAADGTTLKVVFTDPVDPVVDIKDDYVRITIHRPEAAATPRPTDHPPDAPPTEAAASTPRDE